MEEPLSVRALRALFRALDTCPQNADYTYKAARSGIEAALRTRSPLSVSLRSAHLSSS